MRYRNSECCITPEEISQNTSMNESALSCGNYNRGMRMDWNRRDGWNMRDSNDRYDNDNWYRKDKREDSCNKKDKCDDNWNDKDKCDYNDNCSDDLKRRLTELQFAAIDLNLFLDTHPCDEEALAMFKKITKTIESVKMDYVRKYGPLRAGDSADNVPFQWASGEFKWPWEK